MHIDETNQLCSGCRACEQICPCKAIQMIDDPNGFVFPKIDFDLCVNCGLCEKTCPIKFDDFVPKDKIKAFIGWYNSDNVIFESSSGGAFTALYEHYINLGFTVWGVRYEGHLQVVHDYAETISDCELFRKSKYVQSNTNICYATVAEQLKSGKKVLFSGVPCQVAALISYLNVKNIPSKDLVTISTICHGVPSQALFDDYITEEEEKESSEVFSFSFKNKKAQYGVVNSKTAQIEFRNGHNYIRDTENDAFLRGYYKRLFYRPSCYACKFAVGDRISDFTIADGWNTDKLDKKYDPLRGVSLILFSSDKAFAALPDIRSRMSLEEVSTEWALQSQPLFSAPTECHKNREMFFRLWPILGFKKAVFKCTKDPVGLKIRKLARKQKRIIKQFLKKR